MTKSKSFGFRKGLAVFFLLLTVGCASTTTPNGRTSPPTLKESRAKKHGITGALIGSVLGAIIGSRTGSVARGAAIGAGVGAAVGFGIGKHQDRALASRDQVLREYGQKAEGRSFLKLESLELTPAVVRPGSQIRIRATYVLITPSTREKPQIKYREGVRLPNGKSWLWQAGPFQSLLGQRGGGRFQMDLAFGIPRKAALGSYELGFAIDAGNHYEEGYALLNIVS